VITHETKEIFFRLSYIPSYLQKITKSGFYPVEVSVESNDEDVVFCDSIKLIRIFPGIAPTSEEYEACQNAAKAKADGTKAKPAPKLAMSSQLRSPPHWAWKLLVAAFEAACVYLLLQFCCYVPKGTSGAGAVCFGVIAWFFGGWPGGCEWVLLPVEDLDWIVWGIFALACIPFIFLPRCFAWTPWFGGLKLNDEPLRLKARIKRQRATFLLPFRDRMVLRGVSGGKNWDILVPGGVRGGKFRLVFPSDANKLIPDTAVKLVAESGAKISCGIKVLSDGESEILSPTRISSFSCDGLIFRLS
jgi:hypothetical protein